MQAVGSCGDLAFPSQPSPTTPRVQAAELPAQAASSWALVSPTANWLHSRVGNAGAGLGGSRPHANRIQNASTSNAELLAAPGLHVEWNSAASNTQHTRQAESLPVRQIATKSQTTHPPDLSPFSITVRQYRLPRHMHVCTFVHTNRWECDGFTRPRSMCGERTTTIVIESPSLLSHAFAEW